MEAEAQAQVLDQLIAVQRINFQSLLRLIDSTANLTPERRNVSIVTQRKEMLTNTWTRCVDQHAAIAKIATPHQMKRLEYFKATEFEENEEIFMSALDDIA